jgi:hypothetical protein
MRTTDTSINPLPTSRPFDISQPDGGMATAAPEVSTQHAAASRGITMEQALRQAEHHARREEAKHPAVLNETEAKDWLRSRSMLTALIEIVGRLIELEKGNEH